MEHNVGTFYGVSVGPGDPELLTLKAVRCIEQCPVLAAPQTAEGRMLALDIVKGAVDVSDKTILPLRFVMSRDADVLRASHEAAAEAVRAQLDAGNDVAMLNLGDVSIYATYGYLEEILKAAGYPTARIAGVPSFCAAAAALDAEYTLPGVSQTVIITRMAGRTPVPAGQGVAELAAHGATMVVFLSAGMLEALQAELLKGAYTPDTPAALVYKASWPEQRVARCRLGELARTGRDQGVSKTALVLVGGFLGDAYERSRLYAPDFATEFRQVRT